jgi:hypothetical protein
LPAPYTVPQLATFVAVSDLNGDHKADLVVISSHTINIMLGNGDGTFQLPISFNPPYAPSALGVGDFNRDGKMDLAIAEQFAGINQVQIFLGNGDGTFQAGVSYPVSSEPSSVAVGDFRADGKLDLAVAGSLGLGITVLLGNGDGTFQPPVNYSSFSAYWVAAGDLDGDGKLDLAIANFLVTRAPSTVASVMLGSGDGTFQPTVVYPTGKESSFIALGDFNNDHKPDVMVTDYVSNDVIVLLNTGVVSLSPTTPLTFSAQLVGTKSAQQTVTLTNRSTTALSISSMSVQGGFMATGTCGKSVAAGAQCSINVRSVPTTTGPQPGTITIHASASIKPMVIELSGMGTLVKLAPSGLTFAAQKMGSKSAPQQVRLTNTGRKTLTIQHVYLEGNDWSSFLEENDCGSSVAAGGSCTFNVIFDPQQKGKNTAALAVYDSDNGSPQSVNLTGTGD